MNQKGSVNIIAIVLILVLAGVFGYFLLNDKEVTTPTPTPTPTSNLENWQYIDADSFTLSIPPDWRFNKLQGIDSYVGEVIGGDVRLVFDYGWYSNPLEEDNNPDHIVTYETIDGYRAKIVVPKVTGNGTVGVYFDDLPNDNKFNLYGSNFTADQEETALNIFHTLKFKK